MNVKRHRVLMLCLVLLLVVPLFSASAQVTMIVNCGDEEGLSAAITTANALSTTDTINIIGDCSFTFTLGDVTNNDSALPRITQPLIINGSGSTFERADGSPEFRLIYVQSGVLTLNDLTLKGGNMATSNGGLIWASGTLNLNDTTLTDGYAKSGGAIYTLAPVYITNSTLSGNQATDDGGAIYKDSNNLTINNSIIRGNQATDTGGAVYSDGDVSLFSAVITGNRAAKGAAIYVIDGDTTVQNATISGNESDSGAIYTDSGTSLIMINAIVWGNTPQITHFGGFTTAINSLIEGGYSGTNNISNDPLFVNAISSGAAPTTDGDYHLQSLSPAIDAGSNISVPNGSYDIDGDERILYGTVDIGADESLYCDSYSFPYTVPAGDSTDLTVAIRCANVNSDSSTINLTAGVYSFSAPYLNNTALPTITAPLILNGNGATLERASVPSQFRLVSISSSGDVVINDLTVSGGYLVGPAAFNGAGIYAETSLELNRVTVMNNQAQNGGGIYTSASLIIRDSLMSGNQAGAGGGLYTTNSAVIVNSTFSQNTGSLGSALYNDAGGMLYVLSSQILANQSASQNSVYINTGEYTIVNTIISGNEGGIREIDSLGSVINTTIAGNSGAGIYKTSVMTVANSIIWGNEVQIVNDPVVSYSIIEGGYSGTGNLSSDPLFVTPLSYTTSPTTGGDYHIQVGSPATNAGNNAALPVDTYDIDGDNNAGEALPIDLDAEARVSGNTVDIGADEIALCASESVYTVPVGDSSALLTAIICANANNDANTITLADSTYTVSAGSSSDGDSAFPPITTPITINGNSATIARDGSAPQFRLFRVGSGGSLSLRSLTITGGLLSGSASGGGIYNSGTLSLRDVTLTGNSVSTDADGGAIFNDDGTVTLIYSEVTNNSAGRAGGLHNQGGTMRVSNTVVAGNTAEYAGGLFMQGGVAQLTIVNSIISGNKSTLFEGGGMTLNSGTATIINTTIAGNTASAGGGIYNGTTLTVANSIVWGNSSQIVNNGGAPTVTYSIIEGGYTGTGNLASDPLFVTPIAYTAAPTTAGDYHIQAGSPAINAGSNAALPLDTTDVNENNNTGETLPQDFDSNSRIQTFVVDIGADEIDACLGFTSPFTVAASNAAALSLAITCANLNADENVITLGGGTYTFTSEYLSNNDSALPTITTPITINGNGATLERDSTAPEFRLITIDGSVVTLNDLTLRGGRTPSINIGGAIFSLGATVTINRCTITDNYSNSDGGGIANTGVMTIIDSTISNNSSSRSGGIYNGSRLTVINSTISDNETDSFGGGIYSLGGATNTVLINNIVSGNLALSHGGGLNLMGTSTVINTVISGNQSLGNGGGLYSNSGTVTVSNSTITGNTASLSGGGIYQLSPSLTITNSIIWGNNTQISGTPTVTYSIVEGGFTGTGNLISDPLFVTPIAHTSAPTTAGDYHVQAGSPAINAGSNAALPVDTYDIDGDSNTGETLPIDFDGDARVLNSVVDIGADEVDACASASVYTVPAGDENALLTAVSCANANADSNVITLGGGTYTFTAEHSSNNDSAFPTITTPITINGNDTIIERDASALEFRFFSISGGSLTLNDLTLTGGEITSSNGGAISNIGAGIVRLNRTTLIGNASPTKDGGGLYNFGGTIMVIDSTISGNTANRSGGLSNQVGTLTIINSTITGNTAEMAAGIYMLGGTSQLTIINSVISGNTATIYEGGGVTLNTGTATIINSTIAGNNASQGGGIYRDNSAALNITNSIIWGNSSQIVNNFGSPTVSYSIVEGGHAGTGNIDSDPLFVTPIAHTSAPTTAGNYELQDGSPAINVGSNAALPADTYDIDGDSDTSETLPLDILLNARVFNGVVDMGAYENGAVINRLTNASFETAGTTASRAASWTTVKTKTTDKRVCSTVNKPITTTDGDCVFQFSNGNSLDVGTRGIKQVINAPSWGNLGGSLTLSAQVEGNKFKTGARMILQVTYADSSKGKVNIAIPSGTYAFDTLSTDSLTLTQTVTKVIVNIKVGKIGGRLRIDEVVLYLTPAGRLVADEVRDGASALPLPVAPDGFRGGN